MKALQKEGMKRKRLVFLLRLYGFADDFLKKSIILLTKGEQIYTIEKY